MQANYDALQKVPANNIPLSPISFLNRANELHRDRNAVIYGDMRRSWGEFVERVYAVANGLLNMGLQKGDTISVLSPNTPLLWELQFAIPLTGAVLNTLNTRLEPETLAYILDHADSKAVFVDCEFGALIDEVFQKLGRTIPVIRMDDPQALQATEFGNHNYEDLLNAPKASGALGLPMDEWDAIALNYTSGTSGRPKGVVYHHRGAYLMGIGTVATWQMPHYPIYLSIVPMFHCNGWGHPWVMAMVGGTMVFTRALTPENIIKAIEDHKVTHMGAAPIILQMATEFERGDVAPFEPPIKVMTAGAPPPPSVLEKCGTMGLDVMQVYGLTETYGHISNCLWQDEWGDMSTAEQAGKQAQQGIAMPMVEAVSVIDRDTGLSVPQDGQTQGEIAIKGNTVMKGYYKDPDATAESFKDGWFWSGDGAVLNPDGYIQIRDRLKDVIISGGENISSVEVEAVLYRHPSVLAAAVVAKAHPKWGEVPCAFVELRPEHTATAEEIISFCRDHLAGFKTPKSVLFQTLPKTATGKIQKFELRKAFLP